MLSVFENRALRRMFVPKSIEMDKALMNNTVVTSLHYIILGRSDEGGWDGLGMERAWLT
jgi:hypothetical protein